MHRRICFFFLLIGCFSCQEKQKTKILSAGIYHWKSQYQPEAIAQKAIATLSITKQYVRFFDVVYNEDLKSPTPTTILQTQSLNAEGLVPVVFISNETLKNINCQKAKDTGLLIYKKIKSLAEQKKTSFKEIQIDCDWSTSTQQKYFALLESIKKAAEKPLDISATIRLHQVKFREKTGVPPVDRGSLMLYNVGDWKNPHIKNSLFDAEVIDQYIDRLNDYPLALDLALPIYTQTIFYRNTKFLGYRRNISIKELEENKGLKKTDLKNQYRSIIDSTFYNQSFRKEDLFRFENVDFETLSQVKKALIKRLSNRNVRIILFDLDEQSLANYSINELHEIIYGN